MLLAEHRPWPSRLGLGTKLGNGGEGHRPMGVRARINATGDRTSCGLGTPARREIREHGGFRSRRLTTEPTERPRGDE
jgi:hypothetical protein